MALTYLSGLTVGAASAAHFGEQLPSTVRAADAAE